MARNRFYRVAKVTSSCNKCCPAFSGGCIGKVGISVGKEPGLGMVLQFLDRSSKLESGNIRCVFIKEEVREVKSTKDLVNRLNFNALSGDVEEDAYELNFIPTEDLKRVPPIAGIGPMRGLFLRGKA